METDVLRQGDIIASVHSLGAINSNSIQYLSSPGLSESGAQEFHGFTVNNKPAILDVMVLSHSCEISLENSVKLTSIILAPIREASTATKPDKLAELISSNLVHMKMDASYLKYFYLESNPKMKCQNGGIVDFSKCFSVRKNYYDDLVKKKIIQLDPSIASSMALKLSLYFHRTQRPAGGVPL